MDWQEHVTVDPTICHGQACVAGTRTPVWRFIAHAFQSDDIQRQIRDNIGATINQITNKDMNTFRVRIVQNAMRELLTGRTRLV